MFSGPENPEPALVFAITGLALVASRRALRWLGWWERPLARLAASKNLAILIAAALPLVLRALLLPWFPIPEPRIHDEFSFLLAADTLAHGRVVNPQHPLWVHFESMHMLAKPVYASAFPIAQAAALTAGNILFGHSWAGVWVSAGFMCGAICWMLQGWLPPRWALLGTVVVILRLGVSSYWMNSYWGGCLPAAGGALVLGALPRISRTLHWGEATIMGAGLAILAISRPFEGAIFSLAVAVPLSTWMLEKRGPLRIVVLRQIVLPLVLVLVVTGLGLAYYFARVTGKPWLAPYVLYRNTMTVAPHFIFQHPTAEPLYNNREMWQFYVKSEMDTYLNARKHLLLDAWNKLETYWRFYLGPLLTIPLLTIPLLRQDRQARSLLFISAAFALALIGQVWHNPHYAAPATGLVILIVMLGMRRLRLWEWRGRPLGLHLVRSLPIACAAMLLIRVLAGQAAGLANDAAWRWPARGGIHRARILQQLKASTNKHLILVRYDAMHDVGDEWVYNDADIDRSKVVWARELDRGSNTRLMHYFSDRRAWLVEPDSASPELILYRDAPPRLMPFVRLGAPGIEVLRSVPEVKRKVKQKAEARDGTVLGCDVWNYFFAEATGIAGPPVTSGCYGANDRSRAVSFDHWFAWLQRQPEGA